MVNVDLETGLKKADGELGPKVSKKAGVKSKSSKGKSCEVMVGWEGWFVSKRGWVGLAAAGERCCF